MKMIAVEIFLLYNVSNNRRRFLSILVINYKFPETSVKKKMLGHMSTNKRSLSSGLPKKLKRK